METPNALFTRQGNDFLFDGNELKYFLITGPLDTVEKRLDKFGGRVAKLYNELRAAPASDGEVVDRLVSGDCHRYNMPTDWRTDEQGNIRVFYFWIPRDPHDKRFLELHCFWWEGNADMITVYTGEEERGDQTPRPYPQSVAV